MNYFGVNKKVKVDSTYWEGPKERLKQNKVVTHLIEVDVFNINVTLPTTFEFIYKQYADRFKVDIHRDFSTIKVYLTGKRKELLKEFGKLNEVSK